MASVVKDSLWPGVYHLPDGRMFECKSQELSHYQTRLNDMVRAGVPIPFNWEHQVDSLPKSRKEIQLALAEKTRSTLGWANGAKVHADGFLEANLEVPDDADRKRLPSIRFISPTIKKDWTDPNGRFWPGPSIIEFAATSRPVQMGQRPYQLSANQNDNGPWCLSIVQLGANAMAEDLDDVTTTEEDTDTSGVDDAVETPPEPVVSPQAEKMAQAVAALAGMGIILGEDVTPKNFHERLVVALATKDAHEKKDDPASANGDPNAPITEASTPMMMSMANQLKILKDRAEKAEAVIAQDRKNTAKRRLAGLKGFVADDEITKLSAALDKEPITLSADGFSPTMVQIAAYEKAAKALVAAGGGFVNLSQEITEAEPAMSWVTPQDRHGDVTPPEEREAEGDKIASYLTRGRHKAKV